MVGEKGGEELGINDIIINNNGNNNNNSGYILGKF